LLLNMCIKYCAMYYISVEYDKRHQLLPVTTKLQQEYLSCIHQAPKTTTSNLPDTWWARHESVITTGEAYADNW